MGGNLREFTAENWQSEVLGSAEPVLVDFWAPWCPPCRQLAPTISKLAEAYAGKVKVGKLDTDQNEEIAGSLRISGIPAVLIFQGGKEVDRIVGFQAESKYTTALERLGVTV